MKEHINVKKAICNGQYALGNMQLPPQAICQLPIANCRQSRFANYLLSALVCLLLIAYCNLARAQTKKLWTIEEAIQVALENNTEVKAGKLTVEANKSLKGTAYEVPKFDLSAQLGQYNSSEFDQSFQGSQTIPFPTLFGAKKQLISAEIKGKELKRDLTVLELKTQIRTYYYQIQYLQHNEKQLEQLDSLYTHFVKIAELRYNAGDTKKADISTARAKQGEIDLLFRQNGVYLANAYTNLLTLMNTNEDFKVAEAETFQPLQIGNLAENVSVAQHPAIQSLYQEARILEQTQKVEKSNGLPDITLGYVNQSLIGFHTIGGQERYFGSEKRFNSFNIGIAIPLFSATRSKTKSLDLQRQAVEAAAQQHEKQFATQLKNAMKQYQQNLQEFNYYQQKALPNAKEIISAAQLGYQTGDITYVEYFYALQTATDIRLGYLKSIQEVNQSVINIYSFINQ